MRARLCALGAVAGLAAAVIPAHAGGVTATPAPTPQIVDGTGDANFINGQTVLGGVPAQSGPAQVSDGVDVKSVLLQSTFLTTVTTKKVVTVVKKKKVVKTITVVTKTPTGFTVTMTLAGPPTFAETDYRFKATVPGCASTYYIEYSTSKGLGGTTLRCGNTAATGKVPDAVIKDNTITWTVPAAIIPVGAKLTNLASSTLVNVGGAITAPTYDEAIAPTTTTFTVGK
jgi:hypothetical protein